MIHRILDAAITGGVNLILILALYVPILLVARWRQRRAARRLMAALPNTPLDRCPTCDRKFETRPERHN